ncbi:Flp pilus assembly protein CpaB [Clostridium sp. SHJSY1]|nr:Flp pilus assembly protein CpaB [Clostridium sp. SHJSY1]
MKSMGQKLILLSLILALIASVTVFSYLKSLKSSVEVAKKSNIIVAVENIPARTRIDKKMIKEVQVTDDSIFSNYIKDSSEIIGKYTKENVLKDEGFHVDKLLENGGDELSLNIDNNHRAISISVTGDSGVSDLLKPGDYVDIISYIAERKDGAKIISSDKAKIIMQNIELIAVDKQINREEKVNNKEEVKEKTLTNFLVTLSVPTSEIEKLVLAQSIGSIKLALRALEDKNITETNGVTREDLSVSVNTSNGIPFNKENDSINIKGEKYINYTIKAKDTLKSISEEFYGDKNKYTILKEANNIENENLILIGEVIKIPTL